MEPIVIAFLLSMFAVVVMIHPCYVAQYTIKKSLIMLSIMWAITFSFSFGMLNIIKTDADQSKIVTEKVKQECESRGEIMVRIANPRSQYTKLHCTPKITDMSEMVEAEFAKLNGAK